MVPWPSSHAREAAISVSRFSMRWLSGFAPVLDTQHAIFRCLRRPRERSWLPRLVSLAETGDAASSLAPINLHGQQIA
jgi:hypothetical protein